MSNLTYLAEWALLIFYFILIALLVYGFDRIQDRRVALLVAVCLFVYVTLINVVGGQGVAVSKVLCGSALALGTVVGVLAGLILRLG